MLSSVDKSSDHFGFQKGQNVLMNNKVNNHYLICACVSSYLILGANGYGKITVTNISALFKNDSSILMLSSVITGSMCVTDGLLIFHVTVMHSYWTAIDMPAHLPSHV